MYSCVKNCEYYSDFFFFSVCFIDNLLRVERRTVYFIIYNLNSQVSSSVRLFTSKTRLNESDMKPDVSAGFSSFGQTKY